MKSKIFLAGLALFFFLAPAASAHQPRNVMQARSDAANPIAITDYDVLQAFYGELAGSPDYFLVEIGKTSDLYLSLTAPKGGETDFTVTLTALGYKDELDGSKSAWPEFYEEYGGDWYLKGPEKTYRLIPDSYLIAVASQSGQGKYALTVGTKEEFPIGEAIKSLIILPQLKTAFFGRPVWSIFEGKIFQYFGIGLAVFIVLIFIIIIISLVRLRKKKMKETLTNL